MADNFQAAYEQLNPRQREAVNAIDGPVMVIAGPGTGKTQILSLRIANILKQTDTAPENVLALTFTESATANMRKRLVDMIGPPGYYIQIATFHGFANRLIQEYPDYYPTIIGGRNATDIDRITILRDILEQNQFEYLKPLGDKFFYVNEILGAIRDIKNEGLDPAAYRDLVALRLKEFHERSDLYHEKGAHAGKMKLDREKELRNLHKNEEVSLIYNLYEAALRTTHLYDFEDMILETIRAFEAKKEFLLEVQERAQYILVDEHQDTNGAQNRILELLASFYPNPNLFVVGDEKQAIYRFQGASIENFLFFKNKYPDAKLIYLEENYRSTQTILDSAQSLIEHNASTLDSPLKATRDYAEKKIGVVSGNIPEAEHLFLVRRIEELLAAGVPAEEIAVLYRENREAEGLAETFERYNLPFVIESDQNILADPDIQKLVKLLEAVNDLGNEERLIEALHIDFLNIPPLDIYKLLDARAHRNYISLYDLIGKIEVLRGLELESGQALYELYQKLAAWKRHSKNEHFLKFFAEIVRESGYLDHLLRNPGYFEKISKLNTLFGEIKKTVGNRGDYALKDFIQYLSILREHRIMIRNKITYLSHAVRLMTAHKAKGLEFDYVFIYNAIDGRWGNRRAMGKLTLPFRRSVDVSELEKNEDERRLFYMALTRARKMAWITASSYASDGKEQVPSQFITEIRPELKEEISAKAEEEEFLAKKEMLFAPRTESGPRLEDKEFLRELFKRRGFSVTSLNNYLRCPWKYFYVNLLRLPQTETVHQIYGTAAHTALQRFFNAKKEGQEVGKEFLLAHFEAELKRHPLRPNDFAALLLKGRATLDGYYENYAASWNYQVLTEYKIDGVVLSEDLVLTGKLDKIELLDTPGDVTVVDYKVKQPESRNWIEGKTQSSEGDYKRQLVFYKLLLDGMPPDGAGQRKFRMQNAVIDFVEPNDRGLFKQESFEVTGGEVTELRELILKTGAEILNLSFWNTTCGEKECEYCGLRSMLAS